MGGVLPDYLEANGVTIASGRFITDGDVELGRRVAVLGADVADLLFPGRSAIGEEVRLRGRALRGDRRGRAAGQRARAWAPRTAGP